MAFQQLARTRERTTTTGTGDITVAGVVTSDTVPFSAGMSVGDTAYMCVVSGDGVAWEEFLGTYSATNTIQRTTTITNHLGTTAHISLSATSRVFAIVPTDWVALLNQLGGGDVTKFLRADGVFAAPLIRGWHYPVTAATTAVLASNTYANGTAGVGATLTANANGALSAIDGNALIVGDRLLVKNEAAAAHNGIYDITQLGDASHPFILTRVADFNGPSNIYNGDVVIVINGTVNGSQLFQVFPNTVTIVVGTTTFTWSAIVSPLMIGDSGSGGVKGLVPAPSTGDTAAGKFLKADGTWQVPGGGGGSASPGLVSAAISTTLPTSANTGFTTWLNQTTSSVADTSAGIYLRNPGLGSFSMSVRYKTAPATPYTMTFGMLYNFQNSSAIAGVTYYDGTNKLHFMGLNNGLLFLGKANSPTSYSANDLVPTWQSPPFVFWRLSDNGTTITWSYSVDGINFEVLQTTTKSTGWLGATGYSNVGIFIDPTSVIPSGLTLFSFS